MDQIQEFHSLYFGQDLRLLGPVVLVFADELLAFVLQLLLVPLLFFEPLLEGRGLKLQLLLVEVRLERAQVQVRLARRQVLQPLYVCQK